MNHDRTYTNVPSTYFPYNSLIKYVYNWWNSKLLVQVHLSFKLYEPLTTFQVVLGISFLGKEKLFSRDPSLSLLSKSRGMLLLLLLHKSPLFSIKERKSSIRSLLVAVVCTQKQQKKNSIEKSRKYFLKASSNHHLQEMIITLRSKSCTNKNRRAGCYYWDLGRRRIEVDSSRCGLRHGTKCSTNVACAILLSTSLLLRLLPWQKFGLTFMMV